MKNTKKRPHYLRQIVFQEKGTTERIDIFKGNKEEDKKYWKKYQNAKEIRYFKLTETK